jgi:hypothetical protein
MARNRLAEILFRAATRPGLRTGARPEQPKASRWHPYPRAEPALPAEVTELEPFEADPAGKPEPGTAELRVVRTTVDGETVFGVSGRCCCAVLPFDARREYGRPDLSLGALMSRSAAEGGAPPAKTLHWMLAWSESKRPLLRWLNHLRGVHADDLRLIIWDDTDFDIPWELLRLPAVPERGLSEGWLGAEVAVSRRTTLHRRDARPPGEVLRCSGEVVGFVDEGDEEIAGDLPMLRDLGVRCFPTLRDLVSYLERDGDPLSLVYVACHGAYSGDGFDYTLADFSLGELYGREFHRLGDTGGLVFLNACHSGRMILDGRINDRTPRGFAKVFLDSGAAGLIATAAEVGTRTAREAGRTIIHRLRDDPDTPVTVALRDYRRTLVPEAIPPVRDAAGNRALLPFMYSFVYIYYGSPYSTVALGPSSGAGNGGGA